MSGFSAKALTSACARSPPRRHENRGKTERKRESYRCYTDPPTVRSAQNAVAFWFAFKSGKKDAELCSLGSSHIRAGILASRQDAPLRHTCTNSKCSASRSRHHCSCRWRAVPSKGSCAHLSRRDPAPALNFKHDEPRDLTLVEFLFGNLAEIPAIESGGVKDRTLLTDWRTITINNRFSVLSSLAFLIASLN